MSKSKTIGCTFMVAGTTLGAGMLALPMVAASAGFATSLISLCLLWALMCYTALLTMEINIHFPLGSSFGTMAGELLGKGGKIIAFAAMILLFYALTAAYISGGASLMTALLYHYADKSVSLSISALVFTIILGGLVYWKTQAVDYVNRLLFTIKLIALILSMSALLAHVHMNLIVSLSHHPLVIWSAIPIMFTSFGFHGSIPSILKYHGHDTSKLKRIFIIGSAIPLVIYAFWILVTLGVIPLSGPQSFLTINQHDHGSVGALTVALSHRFQHPAIIFAINLFSNVAVTTSFLGVTLGLFDYFHDNLRSFQAGKREMSALLTFLPPLLFALFYPRGFIFALGFAAIALAVLAVLLPVALVWRWRYAVSISRSESNILYKVKGGRFGLVLVFGVGLAIIVLQLITML